MKEVMMDAEFYLQNDPAATSILGTASGIVLGSPISQASSSTSINGQMSSRVELIVPVSSSRGGAATVRILANNNDITEMELNAAGRRIDVNLRSSSTTTT